MTKYFQNRIAESGTAFIVSAFYALIIWLAAGTIANQWWLQMGCLALSAYLFIELNNSNSLIRVRSRMVSSTFLVLTSALPVLFGSFQSYLLYVCIIAAFRFLFCTYQQKDAVEMMYFAFLCIGVASLSAVQLLFFVPVFWVLCLTHLQSLGWRTWVASLIGLCTPYWLCTPLLVYFRDWSIAENHFAQLTQFSPIFDFSCLSFNITAFFVLTVLLSVISFFHLLQKGYQDRIRIRQIFDMFSFIALLSSLYFILQPALYQFLLPIITICASPLIAHFFALTNSKITNILFIICIIAYFLITIVGLIPSLDIYLSQLVNASWIG